MKLDDKLLAQLKKTVSACGGASEFARRCGIDPANISRYLNGKVHSVSDDNWQKLAPFLGEQRTPGARSGPEVIANTAELRECIKDAMMRHGLNSAQELSRRIGYDQPDSIARLLAGKLEWFPDVLSLVLTALGISYDATPLSPAERELLLPRDMLSAGARLVRPIPVVAWANAAGHLEMLSSQQEPTAERWNPETTETVLIPVGGRDDTLAFRISGVSMEPALLDNDVILVEPVCSLDEIRDRRIVVVQLLDAGRNIDGVFCKRFFRHGREIELRSDNPSGRNLAVRPAAIRWIGVAVRKICEL